MTATVPELGAPAAEFAAAKVNLALHVRGRRTDGYHALDTLVVFASVGDVVAAVPSAGEPRLTVDGPFASELAELPSERNLVMRALRTWAGTAGTAAKLDLVLTKNLPLGAGFGGGSADAAAALRLLQQSGVRASDQQLRAIAAGLGADVPMCLTGRPLRAQGVGEILTPVALPALDLVLVHPRVPVSTAAVFDRVGAPYDRPLPPLPSRLSDAGPLAAWLKRTTNGLMPAALAEAPAIAVALELLAGTEGCLVARMSGSGSGCFGLYRNADAAGRAARRLAEERPDWWVMATTSGGGGQR